MSDTLFNAEAYLPSDYFAPSSEVPYITEGQHKRYLEHIAGQIRAVEVLQNNLKLARQLHKAEGYGIDVYGETLKNQIKAQDCETINVQIAQAATKTEIEEALLLELSYDLEGYQTQAGLKKEAWDLKLEGLRSDIEQGRALLESKREEYQLLMIQGKAEQIHAA